MPKYFPITRTVEVPAASDTPNVRTVTRLGAAVRHAIDLLLPAPARLGTAVRQGPITVTTPVKAGATLTTEAAGEVSTVVDAGAAVATSVDGTPVTNPALSGARLGRFRADWNRNAGANSVVEVAVGGRTDWANDANALGLNDGAVATITGNALGARGGDLQFGFPSYQGKDDLTLTSVILVFHVAQSGTALANGDLQLRWRASPAAPWTVLETITGNVALGQRPFAITVPADASDLNTLAASVQFTSALGETYSAQCDAVRLVTLGHLEETP